MKQLLGTILLKTIVVTLFCCLCGCTDYDSFLRGKPDYYAKLAADCDRLLPLAPVTGFVESRGLARNTNALPETIRKLNPSTIEVRSNSVSLAVGTYFISWKRSDQNERLWIMIAHREGHQRKVYSRELPH